MGMTLYLQTASDATIRRLLADPKPIADVIFNESGESGGDASGEGAILDLDKSWHAIHYLLSGSVWEGDGPEAFLLAGGEEVGDVDVGCGPARALRSNEIFQVAATLEGISTEKLAARFNAADLESAEIYPQYWVRNCAEGFVYISHYYESLRRFVAIASQGNLGMLVWIA
jgi:hypothetical protein